MLSTIAALALFPFLFGMMYAMYEMKVHPFLCSLVIIVITIAVAFATRKSINKYADKILKGNGNVSR
jgi:1,4-dihydroxy-2-naphthoate octaprenyltransferase